VTRCAKKARERGFSAPIAGVSFQCDVDLIVNSSLAPLHMTGCI